jgi:hypothetical protein
MTQQRPRLGERGSSYTPCAKDVATRTSATSHAHHPHAMFMLTLARPPSDQMRRDAELAAALWSQEMRHQQQQQVEQQQQRRTPSEPSATEPLSSTAGRERAASMSSPPASPSKRGPPWPGSLTDAAAATPPPPQLTRGAGGALYHALMDPPSSSSSSPATPVMPGLAGIGSVLSTLLGRTPPATREDGTTAAAAVPLLPRSLPPTPQQGITSSPAARTPVTLAGGTPMEAGSPAPYMRPVSEREMESIQGCSAAISRWPGGAAVLVEAGRMAQSFIRVHRQRMADMSAKQSAVLLAWQRTLNVVVENLLKQLLTVALAQQPLRNKLAVVTAKEGERPHLIDAHLVSQLRQCLEAVRHHIPHSMPDLPLIRLHRSITTSLTLSHSPRSPWSCSSTSAWPRSLRSAVTSSAGSMPSARAWQLLAQQPWFGLASTATAIHATLMTVSSRARWRGRP